MDPFLEEVLEPVGEAIERSTSWHELLERTLSILVRWSGAAVGHVMSVHPEGEELVSSGIWSGEAPEGFPALVNARQKARIRAGEDLPGKAWASGAPEWTRELPLALDLVPETEEGGVGAALAIPIRAGGSEDAVLELFFQEPREPDPQLLEAAEVVSRTLAELPGLFLVGAKPGEGGRPAAPSPLRTSPGGSYFAILRELLAREAAADEIRLLDAAVRHSEEAVAITTGTFREGGPSIVYVNPAFSRMTGYPEPELLGRSLRILTGPRTDPEAQRRMRRNLSRGDPASEEMVVYRKDGTEVALRWEIFPVEDEGTGTRHFVAICREDRERLPATKEARRRLPHRDDLTGLPDEGRFRSRLERSLEEARAEPGGGVAVLFVDLDRFGEVNARVGPLAADELLVAVGGRLEEAVRPGDLVARRGRDEFLVLLPLRRGGPDAVGVAERVQERVSTPIRLAGEEIRISASIGIAVSEDGEGAGAALLEDAESAARMARSEGGARFRMLDEDTMARATEEARARRELEQALRREEFRLHYQPIVDLATNRIVGLEALLRWEHPERGTLRAAEFMPSAKATDRIVSIGRWVLRESCRALRRWQDRFPSDPPLFVGVNLSEAELEKGDVAAELRRILEETEAEPGQLQVEVPETTFVERFDEVAPPLRRIRDLGVRICIDDAGARYFSLAHLIRFRTDRVKLDHDFVRDLRRTKVPNGRPPDDDDEEERNGRASGLRLVLLVARLLDFEVVAEGVESSDEQEALARHLASSSGQGYHLATPVDPEAVERLLREGSVPTRG